MSYKYYIIMEDCTVYGTNDKEKADAAAEYDLVLDVEKGEVYFIAETGGRATSRTVTEYI